MLVAVVEDTGDAVFPVDRAPVPQVVEPFLQQRPGAVQLLVPRRAEILRCGLVEPGAGPVLAGRAGKGVAGLVEEQVLGGDVPHLRQTQGFRRRPAVFHVPQVGHDPQILADARQPVMRRLLHRDPVRIGDDAGVPGDPRQERPHAPHLAGLGLGVVDRLQPFARLRELAVGAVPGRDHQRHVKEELPCVDPERPVEIQLGARLRRQDLAIVRIFHLFQEIADAFLRRLLVIEREQPHYVVSRIDQAGEGLRAGREQRGDERADAPLLAQQVMLGLPRRSRIPVEEMADILVRKNVGRTPRMPVHMGLGIAPVVLAHRRFDDHLDNALVRRAGVDLHAVPELVQIQIDLGMARSPVADLVPGDFDAVDPDHPVDAFQHGRLKGAPPARSSRRPAVGHGALPSRRRSA